VITLLVFFVLPVSLKAKHFVVAFGAIELLFGMSGGTQVAHFAHLGGMLFAWGFLRTIGPARARPAGGRASRAVDCARPFNDRSREAGKEDARATSRRVPRPGGRSARRPGHRVVGLMDPRQIMTAEEIRRAIVRVSHEIVERQSGTEGLVLVGIQRRGVPFATRLAVAIAEHEDATVPVGALDITFYRDDLSLIAQQPIVKGTAIPVDLNGKTVVLADDVLYTGRTIRAAMDALVDFGRPEAIRLAVLVDRGHRELPIRADHVGKNVPTSRDELVKVHFAETDGEDAVWIERREGSA
jgi:pyrimidine operon attenuation protein/uracil phosphoribosyltransferase